MENRKQYEKLVNISLLKEEWSSCDTWVSSITHYNEEKFKGQESINDLYEMVIKPIGGILSYVENNKEISFDIPRHFLRYFVYSIGRIAYNLEVKGITAASAQKILEKVNIQLLEQLGKDDKWYHNNF